MLELQKAPEGLSECLCVLSADDRRVLYTLASPTYDELPEKAPTAWHGYIYALEYGDKLKIGHTTNLSQRIKSIVRGASNYGDVDFEDLSVAYSMAHTNHAENEKILHDYFKDFRKNGSELFSVSLSDFLFNVPNLDFRDDSEYLMLDSLIRTARLKRAIVSAWERK